MLPGVPSLDPVVAAASRAAAQAWEAAMQQRRQPCVMPPWEEATYVIQSTLGFLGVGNVSALQFLGPNPQRVALILSNSGTVAGDIWVGPANGAQVIQGVGFRLRDGVLPWLLRQEDTIDLVQQAWLAIGANAAMQISWVEIVLREWPKSK